MGEKSLIEAIATFGCTVRFRNEVYADWDFIHENLNYHGVIEADHSLHYQKAYFHGQSWDDMSLVCYRKNGEPCGIITLHLKETEGISFLCAAGLPIEPIQFLGNVSNSERKRICRAVLAGLKKYHSFLNFGEYKCHAYYQGTTGAIDEWYIACLELARSINVGHQLYIDLEQEIDVIKGSFRKSYKSLISKANKLWKSRILGEREITLSEWQKFKDLHFVAAKNRRTRSDETWDIQYLQILQGHAFLIVLYSEDDKLIGGGFFQYTRDEGIYSVAAYDRSLFDKPLGHLVQWLAINELKRLGIKKYLLGDRPYPIDLPSPTQKELNISHFKEGFATAIRPRFVFCFSPT